MIDSIRNRLDINNAVEKIIPEIVAVYRYPFK